jgi:hypothetical protein
MEVSTRAYEYGRKNYSILRFYNCLGLSIIFFVFLKELANFCLVSILGGSIFHCTALKKLCSVY